METRWRASGLAALLAALTWSAAALAGEGGGVPADAALGRLLDGNARWVASRTTAAQRSDARAREAVARGQKPHAIVFSCSDSRVPPEIVFDQGLGEIFVVRVAGNVPDPIVLGSIEYAVEHLGSRLVVVLGHERCGAVTATVAADGRPEGNVGAIVAAIAPAVTRARAAAQGTAEADLVEAAIDENVRLVAASLRRQSPVIAHAIEEGKLRIVGAKYDLDEGTVALLDGK